MARRPPRGKRSGGRRGRPRSSTSADPRGPRRGKARAPVVSSELSMSVEGIVTHAGAAAGVRRGHPWIYDRAVRFDRAPAVGAIATLRHRGKPIGIGFADPRSPIRVRVVSTEATELTDHLIVARAKSAASLRSRCAKCATTDGVRLVHGEGDGMPGLVIDAYGDTGVVATDGDGAAAFWLPRVAAVAQGIGEGGATLTRLWSRDAGVLVGDEPPQSIVIDEAGATFEVDVRVGQKTGLFLDQRPARMRIRSLARGKSVLNLFSYTGGFSVQAKLGGATRVVSVDSAKPAMAACARNFARNQLKVATGDLCAVDAWKYLSAAREKFDIVVCDPPAFARAAAHKDRAVASYIELNMLAVNAVARGGLLLTSSCSSHITEADLRDIVAAATGARTARVFDSLGAGCDHPVSPAFPEGRYLCTLVVALD